MNSKPCLRLLSTLPSKSEIIKKSFPDEKKFPKLVEFLEDLSNRGLFEVIQAEMTEYAAHTKKDGNWNKKFPEKSWPPLFLIQY